MALCNKDIYPHQKYTKSLHQHHFFKNDTLALNATLSNFKKGYNCLP